MADYCKKCGKELSFSSKRFFKGLCSDCRIEETKRYCKECGKESDWLHKGLCTDCFIEETKRYCKECGKELSFISKRLFKGLCSDCRYEETKRYCKECGKELDVRTYSDVCPDCILEENKRHEGYCKECGKELPAKPDLNWDRTEYLEDVCSDCEFVKYVDGESVNPDKFTARYVGGYAEYPEPPICADAHISRPFGSARARTYDTL